MCVQKSCGAQKGGFNFNEISGLAVREDSQRLKYSSLMCVVLVRATSILRKACFKPPKITSRRRHYALGCLRVVFLHLPRKRAQGIPSVFLSFASFSMPLVLFSASAHHNSATVGDAIGNFGVDERDDAGSETSNATS
eukprot:15065-Pleurochrysis_carterae.AAC.2